MSNPNNFLRRVLDPGWSINLRDLERLTDYVEFDVIPDDRLPLVARKVISSISECEGEILEVALFALHEVAAQLSSSFAEYDELVARLGAMRKPEIVYVLSILSSSRDRKYRDVVESYLKHPSAEVRWVARECLEEMGRG